MTSMQKTEEKQELILIIVDSEQAGHISKQFLCGFHSFKGIPNSHPSFETSAKTASGPSAGFSLFESFLVQDFHYLNV